MPVWVVKKDGSREAFDRTKILKGVLTALEKRPVALEAAEALVERVERQVREMAERGEVASQAIGEIVMEELRSLDQVAYIRFASVYRAFTDVKGFTEEIQRLDGGERESKDG